MIVPLPSFDFPPGEGRRDRLARIVRFYVGGSLSNRRDELGALVARGVDDPTAVVSIKTNCATFSLGVLAAAFGSVDAARQAHGLLATPYQNGMAFVWLMEIATAWGAWVKAAPGQIVPVGACMHYGTPGLNNDHAEWMLVEPDTHGGGGRTDNAVTLGQSDPHTNLGRPLLQWIDPEKVPIVFPDAYVAVSDPAGGASAQI
jgi:hypothetical protein